jgi:hypothetical protein
MTSGDTVHKFHFCMDNSIQKLPRGDVESDPGLSLRLWGTNQWRSFENQHHVIKERKWTFDSAMKGKRG